MLPKPWREFGRIKEAACRTESTRCGQLDYRNLMKNNIWERPERGSHRRVSQWKVGDAVDFVFCELLDDAVRGATHHFPGIAFGCQDLTKQHIKFHTTKSDFYVLSKGKSFVGGCNFFLVFEL